MHQKRVELTFRLGVRSRLLAAYLDLADLLVRQQAPDKAAAVYRRVLEHEPGNAHARTALDALEPPAAPPAAASAPAASFVDLGAMIIDEGGPRDTRMRVEQEQPTGDEQKDFEEMLAAFKRGIEQNLASDDFQTHYDLGVAFKEMGLLDEAIAEFQKALRAPEGRLRTSEALGQSFYEKGQFAIAETILRRAVEGLAGGDDEKIGLLYWLGRACEEQAKRDAAVAAYERALAVDIRFRDINDRIHRLTAGQRQ
jgi:tetratricopeptide (TPR) repeat protein